MPGYGFSLIKDSALIWENTGQRKPVFWHILQSETSIVLLFQILELFKRVLLNVHSAPPSSTQLHPAPSTSTHLISTSNQLHPHLPTSFQPPPSSIHLYPAYFSLHPALCNTLNVIRTKILHVIVNFPKFRLKNFIKFV